MRTLAIGLFIGAAAAFLWMIEGIRRRVADRPVSTSLWPRPDGSTRSYGEVWDLPA